MPELPEVETLCRQLDKVIPGSLVRSVTIQDAKLGEQRGLEEKKVVRVRRSGKKIVVEFADCTRLLIHLRMTGRLLWAVNEEKIPHTRMTVSLDKGNLYLVDPRRFATVSTDSCGGSAEGDGGTKIVGLGAEDLMTKARGKRRSVKTFLMDQRVVEGIGNIYACEILHSSCINPSKKAGDLTIREWTKVVRSMNVILKKAIDCRGTTISDWRDLYGLPGSFQHNLRVYGREGLPCFRCGSAVVRTVLNGRGTFYCPSCQGGPGICGDSSDA
ncbi:MAG TPA: bifunctional DNA-formamidopyrimidine glycosylase/DNA-(apurinic or apyrimidinic site) lyase [Syntrophales bacterium]|nr:bifunctional DNA-formamidopyrimidine glycosylase/DNA-(apurinic or apyrimidinic site) lyase [Syntrophales bacterium]HRT27020.1 bifunctional DNA-formamidopyrimidine glycosylase/DNA-(apurinic or apyrimidinic site) lyase [Syntrophales bacterium]HRT70891.1 bifunctional DNA-formamidopyrimidine glycosylase/DNA-(apurinic or apyrimidinic site) lyase [Syntrophales bacterium]